MSKPGVCSAFRQAMKARVCGQRLWLTVASIGALVCSSFFCSSFFCSSVALADTKQECLDAYDKVQDLRNVGKLQEAVEQAQICARVVCSKAVREDCAQWESDLEAREASVVLEVLDVSGRPMIEGSVSLDGKRWLDHLDSAAHVLSQGAHTLEVTVAGAPPRTQAVVIQEGEKNRKITISMAPKPLPSQPAPPPPPPAIHRIGPWAVGGIGAGALIGGAVTGGVVIHAYKEMKDQCNDTLTPRTVGAVKLGKKSCTQQGFDAEQRGRTFGPATTVLLTAGAALVAGSVIWLVVRPSASQGSATSFMIVPAVSSDHKGVLLEGNF